MSKAQSISFLLSQVRASGVVIAGGTVDAFQAGSTTVRKTIWQDRDKAIEAANPYQLDANGTAHLFGDGLYRIVIKDASGAVKYDRDGLSFRDASSNVYDVADYASLAAAVASIGSTPTTLQFAADVTVSANLVIPSTLELMPLNGAKINHTTYTISYAGSTARWPLTQVFNGTGAVMIYDRPKPQYYGAKGDGVTDDYAALSRFFASLGAVKAFGEMKGDFRTSSALTFTGGVGSSVDFDATITATAALNWVLKFATHPGVHFRGSLAVYGAGDAPYASRTCTDGLIFEGCRGSKFDKLRAEKFLRYGVYVSATGNNTLLNLGDVRTHYCGASISASHQSSHAYTGKVNTGSASAYAQRSVVTLAAIPANLAVNMLARVDGEPYIITAIAGNDVTVYPWIKSTSATGTIDFFIGSGLKIEGDDAASVNFDSLDSTYSAVGVHSASLYGFKGKRLVSQFNGVGLVVGNNTTSGYFASTLESFYTEGNAFDIIKTTAGTVGLTVNGVYIYDAAKYYQLGPRLASYEYDGLYNTLTSTRLVSNGNSIARTQAANGLGGYSTTYSVTADNSVIPIKGGNSISIDLALNAGNEKNFGHNHVTFIVYGRRTGSRVDSIAFTPANVAHTVMGTTSYTVAGVASVMMVTAWFDYEANNWVISATPLQKATSPLTGSAAPSSTPDFIGQEYFATSTSKWYKAKGTASSADWLILN